METQLNHLQINVSDKNVSFPFYKKLLFYLDFQTTEETENGLGMSNKKIWLGFVQTPEKSLENKYYRKNTGLNHLAFKVSSKDEVDRFFKEFLLPSNISTLYQTPKLFPEYKESGRYPLN